MLSKAEVEDLGASVRLEDARAWLRDRVALRSEAGLTDVDQLVYLRAVFPGIPLKLLARVVCACPGT